MYLADPVTRIWGLHGNFELAREYAPLVVRIMEGNRFLKQLLPRKFLSG